MTDRRFNKGDKVRLMQRDYVHEIIEVVDEYGGRYKLSDSEGTWERNPYVFVYDFEFVK